MLWLALGRMAPIADTRAALLVLSVPSAWIASGEFCWARRIASAREILRVLSGPRVRPGWSPVLTCAPALEPMANRSDSRIAAYSFIGVFSFSTICVRSLEQLIKKKGPHRTAALQ